MSFQRSLADMSLYKDQSSRCSRTEAFSQLNCSIGGTIPKNDGMADTQSAESMTPMPQQSLGSRPIGHAIRNNCTETVTQNTVTLSPDLSTSTANDHLKPITRYSGNTHGVTSSTSVTFPPNAGLAEKHPIIPFNALANASFQAEPTPITKIGIPDNENDVRSTQSTGIVAPSRFPITSMEDSQRIQRPDAITQTQLQQFACPSWPNKIEQTNDKSPNLGIQAMQQPLFSMPSTSQPVKPPMMPPNVFASPLLEAKPRLIPGSVGLPPPQKAWKYSKLFGESAKLFRFDNEANQWKERGIGEFQLLTHKETGAVLILMMPKQMLKLCAIHFVTKTMQLSPMSTSNKAWCWHAMNYAEEEMGNFAIKFKSAQSAQMFKDIFEKCQTELPVDETDAGPENANKPPAASTYAKGDLSGMLKQQSESWKCDGCLKNNEADVMKCLCCNSLKHGFKSEDVKDSKPAGFGQATSSGFGSTPASAFTFGTAATGFKFDSEPHSEGKPSVDNNDKGKDVKDKPNDGAGSLSSMLQKSDGSWKCDGCLISNNADIIKCPCCGTVKPGAMVEDVKPTEQAAAGSGFFFGSNKAVSSDKKPGGFTFGSQTQSGSQPSGFLFRSKKSETSEKQLADDKTTAAKTTTDISFHEACKPDIMQGPKFSYGGGKSTSESTSVASSAGFSKYTFDTTDKDNTQSDETTGTTATVEEDSILLKLIQAPSTNIVQEVTERRSSQSETSKAAGSNVNNVGSQIITSKCVAPKSPCIKSPQSPEVVKDGLYIDKEDEDSHIYSEPVIALPDAVDVVTGEKEEEVLFDQRAKLYRFHNGEWTERGVGNMKVLYCQSSEKTRILMRREQILTICCNHYITPELKLMPMPNSDGRAVVWYTMDFADDEPRPEQFSIRFKTAECAKEFEKTVEAAKQSTTDATPPVSLNIETVGALSMQDSVTDLNDVIFVKEETATSDEVEKARKLQLPDNLYMYSRREPFQGCIGCNDGEGMLEGHGETVDCTEDYTEEGEYDDDDDDDDGEDNDGYETAEEETDEGIKAIRQPLFSMPSASQPVKPPMMSPNVFASPLLEAKPRLMPGSVGLPPPQKDEKSWAQYAGTPVPSPFLAAASADSQMASMTPEENDYKSPTPDTKVSSAPPKPLPLLKHKETEVGKDGLQGHYSGLQGQTQCQRPMPGPGFFAQNRQTEPVESGLFGSPGQTRGLGLIGSSPGVGPSHALSPALQLPSFPTSSARQPAKPPMIPPNAIASPSVEAKPRLIPGSVCEKGEKSETQSAGTSAPSPFVAAGTADSQKTTSMFPPFGSSPGVASYMLTAFASEHQQEKQQPCPTVTQTPQKIMFQGFSFTSMPKISEPKDNKPLKPDTKATPVSSAAPNPCSIFSLTPSAPSKETSVSQSKPAGQPTPHQPHATGSPFVLGQGTPTLSFGSLTSSSTEAFKASGDFSGFQGAGQQVFSGKSPFPRKGNRTLSEDDKIEEYEPNVDFKPVVDLPDLVDVKTGEEEEQKLFGERAKLFRFDTAANQWKERGIGEFKLLKHKETGRVRILMRREQVLKLCANHIITKTMTLSPMSTSDKTWCWHAMDYAEEEMKMENFAIKFKSSQSAQKFKDIFEKCQTELPADETDDGSEKANQPPAASKPATGDLSGMFKQQSGSWKCDGCLIDNEADVLKCLCCDSLKPGVKAEDVKDSKPTGFGQATSSGFGSTPASGFTFGTAASSQESSGFKFGSQSQPDEQSSNSQAASGFKFGTQPKADNQPSNSQTGTGFMFGSQPHPDSTPSIDNKDKGKDVKDKPKEGAGSLSSMFQKSDGSWKCDGCLISNNADIIKCPCCDTVKPEAMVEDVKPTEQAAAGSGFSFASNKAASSDQKPGGFTFGSQTQSGSQPSGFLFGSKKSETSKKQLADDEANAAKTTTDVSFPEACKPDIKPGPKFSFGGGKSISESTSIASSAGFSFNKNDSKYTFDTTAKDSIQSDEKSGTTATVEEDSILLKLIQAPSTNTVQEVTERRSSQSETSKAAGSNVDNVGSQNIGGFGVGKIETKGTEQTSDGFVFVGAGGNKPDFAFGSTNKAEGFKFSLEPDKNEKAAPEGFSFNQGNQKPAAQSGFNFSLSMTPTSKSVAPKSPGVKSPQSPEVDKDGLYINKEDDDSHIYFEPVIALPDAVDVVTGEEEEEVLFDQRAKLYRFHNGEWREHGLGNMKVLYCQSSEKTRILMRREQILKICCNHYITPELKLMPMPNSDGRALVWCAMDFADDEPRVEQFSIRFKTAESAKEFEKTVEAAKHSSTDTTPPVSPKIETVGALSTQYFVTDSNDVIFVKEETATSDEVEKVRKLQLPDNFYVYSRREPCQGCIGCNDGEGMLEGHGETVDCTEDYTEEDEYDEDEDDDDDGEDSDGYETEEEETDEGEGECGSQDNESGTTYLAKLLSQEGATAGFASKPTEGLFSGGATVEQDVNGETPATEGFVFGKAKTAGFSFASLAASADQKAFSGESDPNKPFHWQGAGKQLFGAGAVGADAAGGDDNEGVQQGDDPHFEPIVPLPDLIDVKTGEEDEVVEFSNRAKLFRFDKDANQWKEKGIGEMKILRHKVTDKYRFLLRREQVHKLACNHGLTAQIVVTRMNTSETTWCWTAQDYTETEPRVEQFAVKFKTIELAEKFKGKVDAIQERLLEAGS